MLSEMEVASVLHNHRVWLKHLFAVQHFRKHNLDWKNKRVALSQHDVHIQHENNGVQSAVRIKNVHVDFLHEKKSIRHVE